MQIIPILVRNSSSNASMQMALQRLDVFLNAQSLQSLMGIWYSPSKPAPYAIFINVNVNAVGIISVYAGSGDRAVAVLRFFVSGGICSEELVGYASPVVGECCGGLAGRGDDGSEVGVELGRQARGFAKVADSG